MPGVRGARPGRGRLLPDVRHAPGGRPAHAGDRRSGGDPRHAADLFDDLVGVYDARAAVLADIEATATEGGGEVATEGGGEVATADELVALDELDGEADLVVCELAEIMRAEGDDPGDHVTESMDVTC